MEITTKTFGTFEGQEVIEYTLTNDHGVSLSAIPYGATVTKIVTPDKEGNRHNITLNVETLEDMVKHRPFYGATIGRVAGRITKGTFSLDGKTYQIDTNEGENMLHGGPKGLDTKLWDVEVHTGTEEASLTFSYESPAGDNGFPGNLALKVVYILTNNNEWKIDYMAQTDEPTLFNPTNHIYFNLTGDIKQPILDHELELASSYYASVGEDMLPTGKLESVEGTPFDFTVSKPLKEALLSDHEQIKPIAGLDHPFVLDQKGAEYQGKVVDPESGRFVKLVTDQNSVVIYTHNEAVDDFSIQGEAAKQYAGFTLETQTLPDAINQPGFGNIILRPSETYTAQTVYQFGVEE
jgi:aldose 1-epimerase